jgi:hypothetical protein
VIEYRMGRNFIRIGDTVRVTPSAPHKHDGGLATVVDFLPRDGADPIVHVLREGSHHFYSTTRIRRVAQTRHGESR